MAWELSCSMWAAGTSFRPPVLGAWCFSHWNTREVPTMALISGSQSLISNILPWSSRPSPLFFHWPSFRENPMKSWWGQIWQAMPSFKRKGRLETSPVVQWWGLSAFTAVGLGNPGQGTEISSCMAWPRKEKERNGRLEGPKLSLLQRRF